MNRPYRLAATLFHHLPLPVGKLARGRSGRIAAAERWLEWAEQARTDRPLVWFHAASVGEAQVAEVLAQRIRVKYPLSRAIQTHSSPSAENWPHSPVFSRTDYPPPERPRVVASFLEALRPAVLVVSRSDLWPELVRGACEYHIPVAVIGGAVRPTSTRLRWPVTRLLASMHGSIAFVGAVSQGDAERWITLGAPRNVVHVTGDPRDDYTLERTPCYPALLPLVPWATAGHTLVAGSTHGEDEKLVIAALGQVCSVRPDARLIIVPHDAVTQSNTRIAALAESRGLAVSTWNGGTPASDVRVLIVTQPGMLADLYMLGSVAYVGGGLGRTGVHTLAEPAAYAVATLTGPEALNDERSRRFLVSDGAAAIDRTHPAHSLAERWEAWLMDPAGRAAAGHATRQQLQQGSADRTLEALAPILDNAGLK